jgi:5-methylcytosine-specific restriction endonuclease McrA
MRNKELYPENWNDVIRPSILKRDGFKCCMCGIKHRTYIFIDQNSKVIHVDSTEHSELKKYGYRTYRVYLQVSHRNHIKSDCSDANLWSLCPRCHHSYDKQNKMFMRLAKPVQAQSQLPKATAPHRTS